MFLHRFFLCLMAIMPAALAIYSSASAIEANDGDTRIYYQADDGDIIELAGIGPGGKYTSQVLVQASQVRVASPISVTSWSSTDGFGSIRVYYIGSNNLVREMAYDPGVGWFHGGLNNLNINVAGGGDFLYSLAGSPASDVRVGYSAPGTQQIHEAVYNNGWTVDVLNH